ncbi:hypothetical protein [Pseudorhodobacter sp.]|uniref:hypothetical protein n=1 Tax=Pseudorhodobacter sp. TaxID=1934400 RepID=UPI0026496972|nr:hypothetical protein [Pseudorhodobacter sp.]MDN5788066.1 hypothetical protein [Pseudorhodobacter sp.]
MRLQKLAQMALDQDLAVLRAAATARDASLQHLKELAPSAASDLSPLQQAQTLLRYETWADTRRAEINMILARQTAEWLAQRETAKKAFGKTEALRLLQGKIMR